MSQSTAAPPTSPTSSAPPVSISSPDEVMEQLLHHQLEELESSHRHDDVTLDDTEEINARNVMCSHVGSSLSSADGSTPADSVQDKKEEKEVGSDGPLKNEQPEPTLPLEGERQAVACIVNNACTCAMCHLYIIGALKNTSFTTTAVGIVFFYEHVQLCQHLVSCLVGMVNQSVTHSISTV